MNLDALTNCVTSMSCLVIQATNGLIVGMLLFLVATGLTLIFGVLRVVNFAHGSFYMLGAYGAYVVVNLTGSYPLAILGAVLFAGLAGLIFERTLIARIYDGGILLQLLVCYAAVLIIDDLVRIAFGPQYLSMGTPEMFRVPPLRIAGGIVPPFYVFVILAAASVGLGLWAFLRHSVFGKRIRAAAENAQMLASLGTNTMGLRAMIFAIGCMLAGLAGALAAPVRALQPDMGLTILIEAFIVTVIGGMGSIAGAIVASLLIGFTRTFGTMAFPLFTEGLMFMAMALVLVLRPQGLFAGKEH